jgi:hypothetical protein
VAVRIAEGAVGQDHGPGRRAAGHGRDPGLEKLHVALMEHAVDHRVDDLARALAADHHAGTDLPELDAVGNFDHAVEHAEAGVAEVVNVSAAAQAVTHFAQLPGDMAGGGRFEVLAANPGVDQSPDFSGLHAAGRQRLLGGQGRSAGDRVARLPESALSDARHRFELAGLDAQSSVERGEAFLDLA